MPDIDQEYIKPYAMHESGSIPGLPNPDSESGLWQGGIVVYVDTRTNTVVQTSLIGGGNAQAPAQPSDDNASPEQAQEQAITLE